MIRKTLIDYFKTKSDIPISTEIPSNPSKEFVVVSKMGGGMTDMVNVATVNVRSYSTSALKAAELDEKVQEIIFDSVELDKISGVKLGGEGSGIDTSNKRYMSESIFNIYYYK